MHHDFIFICGLFFGGCLRLFGVGVECCCLDVGGVLCAGVVGVVVFWWGCRFVYPVGEVKPLCLWVSRDVCALS